jgi:GNAT superfamily N-acetyltransferase
MDLMRPPDAARIAPVYTPPQARGRGYATALVADLSQALLDRGRQGLFLITDLANPRIQRDLREDRLPSKIGPVSLRLRRRRRGPGMSAAGPSQGANRSPLGGSVAASLFPAASVGVL